MHQSISEHYKALRGLSSSSVPLSVSQAMTADENFVRFRVFSVHVKFSVGSGKRMYEAYRPTALNTQRAVAPAVTAQVSVA